MQRRLLRKLLKKEARNEYTLDIDATQIIAEKEAAQWTYQGEKGYMPLVGTLAENGLIVGDEFRDGNAAPAAGNLEFIRYCEQQMPAGKRIVAVRADSAAYQAAIFNACEDEKKCFAIGAFFPVRSRPPSPRSPNVPGSNGAMPRSARPCTA